MPSLPEDKVRETKEFRVALTVACPRLEVGLDFYGRCGRATKEQARE